MIVLVTMKNLNNLYMKKTNKDFKLDRILKSKIVLWSLFVIALVNMYAYIMSANDLYIAFMFLIGFIISFFSKNMVVILFFAVAIPNLIRFVLEWKSLMTGLKNIRVREGFDGDDLVAQAEAELSGDSAGSGLDDSAKAKLGASLDKMGNTEERLRKIVNKAKDSIENIPDREKRDEMKNLISLEENIIDQLSTVSKMLMSIKDGDGKEKPSTEVKSPAPAPAQSDDSEL